MRIQFNTGRVYTKEGQVIVAEFDADTSMIRFSDKSRMIDGEAGPVAPPSSPQHLQSMVMGAYDNGLYSNAFVNLPRDPMLGNEAMARKALHRMELSCRDCGEPGERAGHQGCQYPQDHA